jgi:hypothetical protein
MGMRFFIQFRVSLSGTRYANMVRQHKEIFSHFMCGLFMTVAIFQRVLFREIGKRFLISSGGFVPVLQIRDPVPL